MSTDPGRRAAVEACVGRLVDGEGVAAVAVEAGRGDGATFSLARGRIAAGGGPLRIDDVFAVASITKLLVATLAVRRLDEGRLTLGEKVTRLVDGFRGPGRASVRVRHLLTHTSGLPDLLPDDLAFRRRLAPLADYRDASADVPLQFEPGRGASYSSLGFLWLAEILAAIDGRSVPEQLRAELFEPLGMTDTRLGGEGLSADDRAAFEKRRVRIELDERQRSAGEGTWNSPYWLDLAAPWGGAFATAGDLGLFARAILAAATGERPGLLSRPAVAAMFANQLAPMPDVPEVERRCRPWGLGWQHVWANHPRYFGDLLGPAGRGHGGASGTVLWIDPSRGTYAVILTSRPVGPRATHLARLSNAVAAALG